MGAQVDLPSSTRYAEGSLRFSRYTSMHYIIACCRIVVVVNSPMRVDSRLCMNVLFLEQAAASITDDSRCGMSDVALRTTPPIGGLSCYIIHNLVIFRLMHIRRLRRLLTRSVFVVIEVVI